MNPTRHVFSAIAATTDIPSGPDTGYLGELVKAAAVGTIPTAGCQDHELQPFFGAEAHVKMASAWDKIQDTVGSDWGYLVAPAAGAAIGGAADLGLAGLNKLRGKKTTRTPGLRGALLGAIAGLSGKFAVQGMNNLGEGMIPPAAPGEEKSTGGLSALGGLIGGAPAYAMSGMKSMAGNAIGTLEANGIYTPAKGEVPSKILGTELSGVDHKQLFGQIRRLIDKGSRNAPIIDTITGRSRLDELKKLMGFEVNPALSASQQRQNAAAGRTRGAFDAMSGTEQRNASAIAGTRAGILNSWDNFMQGLRNAKEKFRAPGSTVSRVGGASGAAGKGIVKGIASRPVGTARTVAGATLGALLPSYIDRNTTDLQKDLLESLQRTVYKD